MTDTPPAPIGPSRTASASVFVATFASLLVAIVLLLFFDLFLARVDQRESTAHAASEYADGTALLRAGRAAEAVDRFGVAVAIDRRNVNYALALAESMLEEGRVADAEATLKALLDRAENDGAVNLTMAHVMVREQRTAEAKAFFHRAIFGRWGADSLAHRSQARFELIDLLTRAGNPRELLAELLPFEETSPDSIVLRRRLGHLFLVAGSPTRAATMFRELLRRNPGDADAFAGMGEAALALGNFRTARVDLAQALRLRPNDAGIARRLALADTVLALDPTSREIGSHEWYVRSQALLARTAAVTVPCPRPAGAAHADSAHTLLSLRPSRRQEAIVGEASLSLASQLWGAAPVSCRVAMRDSVLRLVHARLAP